MAQKQDFISVIRVLMIALVHSDDCSQDITEYGVQTKANIMSACLTTDNSYSNACSSVWLSVGIMVL